MSKVVKGSLKYVEGSDPYWVFMRAVALLDDEMECSGLSGWLVEGTTDPIIKSKDLALLLAQELPTAQKNAVIKVIKVVKHDMVIAYYPYFETALKFVWALALSGGGGAGSRAERQRKRDQERDRDTPAADLPVCSYCGRGKHLVKNCRKKKADIPAKEKEKAGEEKDTKGSSRDECWNCHKPGHPLVSCDLMCCGLLN